MTDRSSGAFNQKSGTNAAYDCTPIVNVLQEFDVSFQDAPQAMQGIAQALRQYCASQSGTLTPETWINLRLAKAGIVAPAGHGGVL